jgi:putative membrane protein
MMGYGYGMGAGGWIAMTIFWVGLITLIIWTLTRALPSGSTWGRDSTLSTPRRENWADSAEDILDRRFAAGELDEETYRSMRATLRSARAGQNEPR